MVTTIFETAIPLELLVKLPKSKMAALKLEQLISHLVQKIATKLQRPSKGLVATMLYDQTKKKLKWQIQGLLNL